MSRSVLARDQRPPWRVAPVAAPVIILAYLAPHFLDRYEITLLSIGCIFATAGISLTVLLGWSGQFALINVAFMGLGAYTGARVASLVDIPLEAVFLIAALAASLVGFVLGALLSRLSQYYLALSTIALTYVFDFVYRTADSLTGGVSGFRVPHAKVATLGGLQLATDHQRYYVSLALVIGTFAFFHYLARTRLGRSWRAIKEGEQVARALGIDVYRSRLVAFVICAVVFAVVGSWFPYIDGIVFPESFSFELILMHVLIVIVGGMGSIRGALTVGFLLTLAETFFRGFVGVSEIVFGMALLLTVLYFRIGVYGTIARRFPRAREPVV